MKPDQHLVGSLYLVKDTGTLVIPLRLTPEGNACVWWVRYNVAGLPSWGLVQRGVIHRRAFSKWILVSQCGESRSQK